MTRTALYHLQSENYTGEKRPQVNHTFLLFDHPENKEDSVEKHGDLRTEMELDPNLESGTCDGKITCKMKPFTQKPTENL